MSRLAWTVLLIGGNSGAGKSTLARWLGRRLGIPWLMVDDLRLALQRSRAVLPSGTDALHYFADIAAKPDIWSRPPEELCDALIGTAEALAPALEVIVENHVDQRLPLIIEGDGIAPSLPARPALQAPSRRRQIRAVFVVELDEDALLAGMRDRGRAFDDREIDEQLSQVRASLLFGAWLAREAAARGLPIVPARPRTTLQERIEAACGSPFAG